MLYLNIAVECSIALLRKTENALNLLNDEQKRKYIWFRMGRIAWNANSHWHYNYGDAIAILLRVLLWTIKYKQWLCNGCLNFGFSKSLSNGISLQNCGFQIAIVLQRAIFISLLFSSVYIPIACVCVLLLFWFFEWLILCKWSLT